MEGFDDGFGHGVGRGLSAGEPDEALDAGPEFHGPEPEEFDAEAAGVLPEPVEFVVRGIRVQELASLAQDFACRDWAPGEGGAEVEPESGCSWVSAAGFAEGFALDDGLVEVFQGGVVAGAAEGVCYVIGAEEVPDGGVSDGVDVGAGAGVLGDAGGDFGFLRGQAVELVVEVLWRGGFGAFRELDRGVMDEYGGSLGDEAPGVAGVAFGAALD